VYNKLIKKSKVGSY